LDTPGLISWVGFLNTNTTWPGQAGHGKRIEKSEGLNNYVNNYLQPLADVFFGGLVQKAGELGRDDGKKTTVMESAWGGAELPEEE